MKLLCNNDLSFMKKDSSASSPNKGKRKKPHSPCLGDFGFACMQIVQGKECRRKIEGDKKLETCFHIGCNNEFKSEQGRGDNERACALVQQQYKEKRELENDSNNTIDSIFKINFLGC